MGSTGDPGRGEEVAGVETTVSGVEQHHHSTQGGSRFQENVRTQTEAGEGSDQDQPAAAGVSSQSP